MSEPQTSGSPYIIICNGRTQVALAKDSDSKVLAATSCAADFAAYMGSNFGSEDDFKTELQPVTTIQHELMNHALGTPKLDHDELEAKIVALFDAMSAMEAEY